MEDVDLQPYMKYHGHGLLLEDQEMAQRNVLENQQYESVVTNEDETCVYDLNYVNQTDSRGADGRYRSATIYEILYPWSSSRRPRDGSKKCAGKPAL